MTRNRERASASEPGSISLPSRLAEIVRAEFREDVFYPSRDNPAFLRHFCLVDTCGAPLNETGNLCQTHKRHWCEAGRPDLGAWLSEPHPPVGRTPAMCTITSCGRATKGRGLCQRHYSRWGKNGRPPWSDWVAAVNREPHGRAAPHGGADSDHPCQVPECPLRSDGPSKHLCRSHFIRWETQGRPADVDSWTRGLGQRSRIRLDQLAPSLRLEIAYGLQLWSDDGNHRMRPVVINRAVAVLASSGITSLLEVDLQDWFPWWNALPESRPGDARSQQFLHRTRRSLEQLQHEGEDAWSTQFPRDRWDLRVLGVSNQDRRSLDFRNVRVPWLRRLAKCWCRWRLLQGLKPTTVSISLCALVSLSDNIERRDGLDAGPEALGRARLETWLSDLALEYGENRATRAAHINSVGLLLRDNVLHDWLPEIPRSARIERDTPVVRQRPRRAITDYVLRQLDSPAALARFPSDHGRLLIRLGLACGLRLGDARRLPFDCVIRDAEGHPYLAWINHKIRNEPGYFPLEEDLVEHITAQQEAATARFPQGTPWLFPATANNLTGSEPLRAAQARRQLRQWLADLAITDEHGQPVYVTYHQFRHTLATRLLNRDVPITVVQDLLGHASPQTTIGYARYNLDSLRRHLHRAVIPPDAPASKPALPTPGDVDSASITLPHGRCGAPIQTTCEFANPCLTCRFFVTDSTFRDQHQRQRDTTTRAIDAAERAGATTAARNNTRTLIALDTVLASVDAQS